MDRPRRSGLTVELDNVYRRMQAEAERAADGRVSGRRRSGQGDDAGFASRHNRQLRIPDGSRGTDPEITSKAPGVILRRLSGNK